MHTIKGLSVFLLLSLGTAAFATTATAPKSPKSTPGKNNTKPGATSLKPKKSKTKYTVKKGDTLWDIAKRKKISLAKLEKSNKQIKNFGLIFPGQKINIPGQKPKNPPRPKPATILGRDGSLFRPSDLKPPPAVLTGRNGTPNQLPLLTGSGSTLIPLR